VLLEKMLEWQEVLKNQCFLVDSVTQDALYSVNTRTYPHIYKCIYACTHTRSNTHIVHVSRVCIYVDSRIRTCRHMLACMYTYICVVI